MESGNKVRWLYAVNGIIALLFLGLIYAWSVFVGPLESEFGWLRSQTSLTFSISMAAFCLGGLTGGVICRRWSGRVAMCIAAAFILCGFLLSSTISALLGLYLCYGVLCGFGVGVGYNAVLSSVLAWFKDRQGLMSGVLLMGFGFGGSLLGSVAVALITSYGWRTTFRILGIALSVLLVLSSLLLKKYQDEDTAGVAVKDDEHNFTTAQMVRERSFYGYFLWSLVLSAAGLALVGNAASFAGSLTVSLGAATMIAGLINIFNGIGRLSFGFLLDALGTKKSFLILNCGFFAASLLLIGAVYMSTVYLLVAGFIVAGFCYGGVTSSNSAFASKVFGLKYYSTNLSVVNMVLLIAAFLGPYSAGMLQTASGGYLSTTILIGVFCLLAFPAQLLISRHAPSSAKK